MTLQEKADSLSVSTHTLRNWKRRDESVRSGSGDLTSRANKLNSRRRILPRELLGNKENAVLLASLTESLKENALSIRGGLLFFIFDFLDVKGVIRLGQDAKEKSLEGKLKDCEAPPALKELFADFLEPLSKKERKRPLKGRLFSKENAPLTGEYDLPGLVYQSLRQEGSRSRSGSWFTPLPVVDALLSPGISKNRRLFDPCCGSGLFLCRFAELKGSSECVTGADKDPLAVFLAKINLYLRFPVEASLKAVRQGDSLSTADWKLTAATLVATNPPWGAHFDRKEKKMLSKRYPEIQSGESASLFIAKAVREMSEDGSAAFLIPQALFNVKAHRDVRELLLRDAPPAEIQEWGRLFKGVYSEVISCRFVKKGKQKKLKLLPGHESQPLSRYKKNRDWIINTHCSNKDQALIEKIEAGRVKALPEGCIWLLGVVTGDNSRFIRSTEGPETLPMLTGKELRPFAADPPRVYLEGDFSSLQQSRKPEEYGMPKLVYRFIGHQPVFSLDRRGLVTLNSANSLIPPEAEELEEMVFWYNSALFRFLWHKKYRSVKMLRHQLLSLPLPLWNEEEKQELSGLVKEGEKMQDMPPEGDRLIFRHFNLNEKEIRLVFKN